MFEVLVDKQESTIKTVAWWVNYYIHHGNTTRAPPVPCLHWKRSRKNSLNFLSCFVFFLISIRWCHLKHLHLIRITQAC